MFAMTNLYISQSCMFQFVLSHDILNVLLPQTGNRKGVHTLTNFASFLIAVAAGVACHYIIKWLDDDN